MKNLNEYLKASPLFILNTFNGDLIPVEDSTQLNPVDLRKEARNVTTSRDRRLKILKAFRIGRSMMKELDVPAYRVIFSQTNDGTISVWFD